MATARSRPSSDSVAHLVERSQLRPGDHIYTWRALGIYSHHGIYTGKKGRKVIHFTGDQAVLKSKSSARIRASSLEEFLEGGSLHMAVYGHTKELLYYMKRSGTCYSDESDLPEKVVKRAETYLDDPDKWDDYNLFFNNCESFAVYCKTGKKQSQQGVLAAIGAYTIGRLFGSDD